MRIVREFTGRRAEDQSLALEVAAIIDEVRAGGDAAVRELTERFDKAELGPEDLKVTPSELESSVGVLEPAVLQGLRTAIDNVRQVAKAQLRASVAIDLPAGQRVEVDERPVARAGIYVPGGRAPYMSTVVMGAITAHAAGVPEIVVCAPPGPGGRAHPAILAACVLCDVIEVYRMGGAQAIAALAYGTESVRPVDVIAGPGNAWVTEAKRQVYGQVGIDGLAGPSELVVFAGTGADPELIALDLLAQAEHGPGGLLAVISMHEELLDAVLEAAERLSAERPSAQIEELHLLHTASPRHGMQLVDQIAPEHLELVGQEPPTMADRATAGCVFVGSSTATAFGDYVAGSNHVLPTGGAARFQSALSPATFRRRMARVSLPPEAARRLAPAGAALARAEGFPVHAESMERRA